MRNQLDKSLGAIGVDRLAEYYLHQPDTEHDLLESLITLDELRREGKIGRVGLSNYHAAEVARACEVAKAHNLTPPTVYQGLYNPLNRLIEDELLPCLRANGISFVAYNPLAAGLLTGKHRGSSGDSPLQGRFKVGRGLALCCIRVLL